MPDVRTAPPPPFDWSGRLAHAFGQRWRILQFCAIALVVALSPSSHHRRNRLAIARQIYLSTRQVLPWFTLLICLLSLVIIRIVIVTALSYGLSQYALEMVVRVLVLELIPLSAALFVALRAGLAFSAHAPSPGALAGTDLQQLRDQGVPQLVASIVLVLNLALLSSLLTMLLAYVNVYGLSLWGLADYTRTVARVFDPVVTLGFLLKTALFGLAVALIPMAAQQTSPRPGNPGTSTIQPGAIGLLLALFLIEAASLGVKYI